MLLQRRKQAPGDFGPLVKHPGRRSKPWPGPAGQACELVEGGGPRERDHAYVHRLREGAAVGEPTGVEGAEVTPAPVVDHIPFPRAPVRAHQRTPEGLEQRRAREGMMTTVGVESQSPRSHNGSWPKLQNSPPGYRAPPPAQAPSILPPGSSTLRHSLPSSQNDH